MKIIITFSHNNSFKFLFLALFLITQNIKQSYQQKNYANYYQYDLTQVIGPESIAFDCKEEGPYVGVSDGRILKWEQHHLSWKEFAIPSPTRDRKVCDGSTNPNLEPKCGRPLGLKFNRATCNLYIADAYFGLLMVGPNGGVARPLATSAEGVPFGFTNALDIDTDTGVVYFTDSSTIFQRRNYILSGVTFDKSGRLLKYDPRTKNVTVLYKNIAFPNGVALSKDNSFLIVAESTRMRILKFNLQGTIDNSYVLEVFAQLLRVPDNIKANDEGEFWVALNSGRGRIQREYDNDQTQVFGDKDNDIPGWLIQDPVGLKFDQDGNILKQLDGNGGTRFDSVSEVSEVNGKLYIGSVVKPYLGRLYA